jgi:hypothetical protein
MAETERYVLEKYLTLQEPETVSSIERPKPRDTWYALPTAESRCTLA